MNDFVSGARSAPSSWLDLVTAMKAMPYTDDVRLAWIKLLSRADCPTDAARALEASTSKSVREAALARIRSGP